MYNVEILSSTKELTKRDRLRIKDFTAFNKLDAVIQPDEKLIINNPSITVLHVENSESENNEYDVYVIETDEDIYYSSSQPLYESLKSIIDEMGDDESYSVELYKVESKNYNGRYFMKAIIC